MSKETETEVETEVETKVETEVKVIDGFSVDVQKVIDLGYVPDDIDDFLDKVTFQINYDNDPLKVLVVDRTNPEIGDMEFVISLGQLNQSIFHITKSSAKSELLALMAASSRDDKETEAQAATDEWVIRSEENVNFYEILRQLDFYVNNAGWDTKETRDKVLNIVWKEQSRISDNYEGQLP